MILSVPRLFGGKSEARIRYGDNEFKVLSSGDFVRCAVTEQPIPIADLKYWSVERQEAYASSDVAVKRYLELNPKR
jgi:hypothetical protein